MKKQLVQAYTCINTLILFSLTLWLIGFMSITKYDINYIIRFQINTYEKKFTALLLTLILFVHSTLYSEVLSRKSHSFAFSILTHTILFSLLVVLLVIFILIQQKFNESLEQNSIVGISFVVLIFFALAAPFCQIVYMLVVKHLSLFWLIFTFVIQFLITVLCLCLLFTLNQLKTTTQFWFQSQSQIQPTIIADKGNQHLAMQNTVESIFAVAERKYAKEIKIDVAMTNDSVLVGASLNNNWLHGKKINVEQLNYTYLFQQNLGAEWVRIDPYGRFHQIRYQSKSLSDQYQLIQHFKEKVEKSQINTLDELLAASIQFYLPVTLQLNINDNTRQSTFIEQLLHTLQNFGLTSVDKAHSYKLKTDSFSIYQSIVCSFPFVKFLLPSEAFKFDWDSKLICKDQIDLIRTTDKGVFGNLKNFNTLNKMSKMVQKGVPLTIDLYSINSVFSYCLSKVIGVDRIVTNLELEDLSATCYFTRFQVTYIVLLVLLYGGSSALFAVRIKLLHKNKIAPMTKSNSYLQLSQNYRRTE
ncbi:Conserved_hypothetical protein [Hexamita inflata]|uniref:Transmembrane protein n=1 Tax=Hexamita inflata TaxID=28002 RepID=A0AA86PT76_9EUKA|nr:Conserved hypothetical protein [Hexamita inflata]